MKKLCGVVFLFGVVSRVFETKETENTVKFFKEQATNLVVQEDELEKEGPQRCGGLFREEEAVRRVRGPERLEPTLTPTLSLRERELRGTPIKY